MGFVSHCACPFRACLSATLETQRAVAQVYVCALHRIWCKCGVQQQSHVMSFLCMGRCGVSRWRKAVASQPSGRDPRSRTYRTVSPPPGAIVQRRSRALRPYSSRIPWACVVRACHSLLAPHPRALTLPPVEQPTWRKNSGEVHTEGINLHAVLAVGNFPEALTSARKALTFAKEH